MEASKIKMVVYGKLSFPCKILLSSMLLCALLYGKADAQDDRSEALLFDQLATAAALEYGVDQELVNGVNYETSYYPVFGHPYHVSDTFTNGNVVYHGKAYSDLFFKYDVFRQQLLVKYTFSQTKFLFYLANEFVSEFTIESKKFIKRSFPGEEKDRIYQVIGEAYPVKLLYAWKKIRVLTYHSSAPSYTFTEDEKDSYLLIDNKLLAYSSNRSFIRRFPKQDQTGIKKYIRDNKISVKNSNDTQMDLLLKFCSSPNHASPY